jgi:hypothetical protein
VVRSADLGGRVYDDCSLDPSVLPGRFLAQELQSRR